MTTLLWLIFTLVVFSILVRLSIWQYDRGQQKEQRLMRITQLSQNDPLSLTQLLALPASENLNDYPVSITGTFDNHVLFLLDNQVESGTLGYRVLQLLRSENVSALINLGWVKGSINRQELPDIQAITGQYQFTGHVRLVETGIMLQAQHFAEASWPLRIQQIELNKFSTLLNEPILPFVIYVDAQEKLGYLKNWQAVVMPPAKHFGYSVQWAGLAVTWLLLMLWLKFSRTNHTKPKTVTKALKNNSPTKHAYNKNNEAIKYD
ncbi:SURF1 family protein [Colwellia sp. D2M02]|uniref:SURF1 family protein n=1 Tax=Colwellia sp. D2M02 TaxID=2841562 RepID=UPI001C0A6302|nr:SURF1 family protein [Colwellia sp. D2M02]MBU2892025.1 SURF1 family protein [Colwellia sp. D2M02]